MESPFGGCELNSKKECDKTWRQWMRGLFPRFLVVLNLLGFNSGMRIVIRCKFADTGLNGQHRYL